MSNKSIPRLLQEANEIKKVLEKIGAGLPDGLTAADMAAKIARLETAVSALDALNAERTRLINRKGEQAEAVRGHLVQVRAAVKGIFGADSSEYDMVGGTRVSERKTYTRKAALPEGKAKEK